MHKKKLTEVEAEADNHSEERPDQAEDQEEFAPIFSNILDTPRSPFIEIE